MIISKARPLFRRHLRMAPAHPLGERVLVREFPPESKSEGGIETPDTAKMRYFAGTLIAAGDQAADKLWDLGVEIGDEIWYGKYAGLLEEWHHIVGPDNPNCDHGGAWEFVPKDDTRWRANLGEPNENMTLRSCRACGDTLKVTERVIVLSVDDMVMDVDLQVRLESGEMRRVRDYDADDRTRYRIERPFQGDGDVDTFEFREPKEEAA